MNMIENYDKKIRLVIGGLMAKADTPTKSVLTAYDPSKDGTTNRTVLGGSKFQVSTLDACANFLRLLLLMKMAVESTAISHLLLCESS